MTRWDPKILDFIEDELIAAGVLCRPALPLLSVVHPCCGCSCTVCLNGHEMGEHTYECWRRFADEQGL